MVTLGQPLKTLEPLIGPASAGSEGDFGRYRQLVAGLVADVIGPEFGSYYELDFPDVNASNVAHE